MGAEGLEDTPKAHETPRNAVNGHRAMYETKALRDGSLQPTSKADLALREAIHAAVDEGLYERAERLLDVLKRIM